MNDHLEQAILAVAGPTGFGLWLRERRRTRKDVYSFALDLIAVQNARIDDLSRELGNLQGQLTLLATQNATLAIQNAELKLGSAKQ